MLNAIVNLCKIMSFVAVLLLTPGCFLDSRMFSLEDNSSNTPAQEIGQKLATYTVTPLYSSQSLSRFLAFDIEFSDEVSDLSAANIDITGGVLKNIVGSQRKFRIEVEAEGYSEIKVGINNKTKFSDATVVLSSETPIIETTPKLEDKKVIVSSQFVTGNNRPAVAPDNSIYIAASLPSWTANPSLFGNLAIYDQSGQRLSIVDEPAQIYQGKVFSYPDGSYLAITFNACILKRYLVDGTIDTSFASVQFDASSAMLSPTWCGFVDINSVIRQSSGKIVIAGRFGLVNGAPKFSIVRLNTDGTVDNSFVGTTQSFSDKIYQLYQDNSGKIFILGEFSEFNGDHYVQNFNKIDADGNTDGTFYSNRCCTATQFRNSPLNMTTPKMIPTSNNKIYITGIEDFLDNSTSNFVDLYDSNGVRDLNFTANLGTGFVGEVGGSSYQYKDFNSYVQSDNKLVLITKNSVDSLKLNGNVITNLFRLNEDGTLDTGFGFNVKNVGSIELNAQNNIEIRHSLTSYDSNSSATFLKVLPTGQVQDVSSSFSAVLGYVNDFVFDKTGKSYLSGITKYGATTVMGLARLNSDYTLDSTFNTATGFAAGVAKKISLLDGGGILVTGSFTSYKGVPAGGIVILDSSANLVSGLNYTGFTGGAIIGHKVLANGKIVVWGIFTAYKGITVSKLVLLDQNLNLETSFQPQSTWGALVPNLLISEVCEFKSGKLLVVGYRSNTTFGAYIAKMDQTGSADQDDVQFNALMPTSANNKDFGYGCYIHSDDSIVMTGRVTNFQGVSREGPIHILNSGIVNHSFFTNTLFPSGRFTFEDSQSMSGIKFFNFPNFSMISTSFMTRYDVTKRTNLIILNPL